MFIGRKPDGSIYGTWTSPQPRDSFHLGIEEVTDNHPDVVAFANRQLPVRIDTRDAKIAELESRLNSLEVQVVEMTPVEIKV